MRKIIRKLLESIDYELLLIIFGNAVTTVFFVAILFGLKEILEVYESYAGPFWLVDYIKMFHEGYCLIFFIVNCVLDLCEYIKRKK